MCRSHIFVVVFFVFYSPILFDVISMRPSYKLSKLCSSHWHWNFWVLESVFSFTLLCHTFKENIMIAALTRSFATFFRWFFECFFLIFNSETWTILLMVWHQFWSTKYHEVWKDKKITNKNLYKFTITHEISWIH